MKLFFIMFFYFSLCTYGLLTLAFIYCMYVLDMSYEDTDKMLKEKLNYD